MHGDPAPPGSSATPAPCRRSPDIRRHITYESELDPAFGARVAAAAHGQQLSSCIQCGTCSGTCPVSDYMDLTPRRIIAMVREGFRREVLQSATIWLCASCYSCTVECPRQIKLTDVMYALKQEAIREGAYPRRFPIPILARVFFDGVKRNGRSSEVPLMARFYLRAFNPVATLKNIPMAVRMFFQGRLPLFEKGMRQKGAVAALLRAVAPNEGRRP